MVAEKVAGATTHWCHASMVAEKVADDVALPRRDVILHRAVRQFQQPTFQKFTYIHIYIYIYIQIRI